MTPDSDTAPCGTLWGLATSEASKRAAVLEPITPSLAQWSFSFCELSHRAASPLSLIPVREKSQPGPQVSSVTQVRGQAGRRDRRGHRVSTVVVFALSQRCSHLFLLIVNQKGQQLLPLELSPGARGL